MTQNDKEKVRMEIFKGLFKEYKHLLFEIRAENNKHSAEADRFIAELKQRIEHSTGVSTK